MIKMLKSYLLECMKNHQAKDFGIKLKNTYIILQAKVFGIKLKNTYFIDKFNKYKNLKILKLLIYKFSNSGFLKN